MYNEEEKIVNLAKSTAFLLFILLMGSLFDKEMIIIALLGLIYLKTREKNENF